MHYVPLPEAASILRIIFAVSEESNLNGARIGNSNNCELDAWCTFEGKGDMLAGTIKGYYLGGKILTL